MMNDKSIIDLLYRAKENRIDVFLNEGQLQLKLPTDKRFDKDVLEEIKAGKEAILSFLNRNERSGSAANKVTKADRQAISRIPLSYSQERLWFVDKLEGTIPYHVPFILKLKGRLDADALSHALNSVVQRHEVLRTIILSDGGTGYQSIRDAEGWQLQLSDASGYRHDEERLQQKIESLVKAPFDLSKDYMLRADLLQLHQHEHLLVVTMHHIASDGWSASVLVKELIEFYASYIEDRPARVEALPLQYADYAIWQRNYLQGDVLEKKIAYWKEKLDGITPTELPVDFVRPAVQSTRGDVIRFTIDKDVSEQLQELSKRQGATLFMTLFTAVKVLLYRYTGQQDICIGTGSAGRQRKELEGLIGFFVNMLALRSEVKGDASFTELLQQVRAATMEAYEHQDLPFEKVVSAVVEERDMSRSPLFQVLFEMQNTPEIPELRLGELELKSEPFLQHISKFDITFFVKETSSGLSGSIEYCTDLYSEQTVVRMLEHYKRLLASIAENPSANISELQMLSNEEQRQLLAHYNNTTIEYPKDKSVIALIEEQAAEKPGNVAIIFKSEQLTYQQLNERANQLAHHLISKGVKRGMLIPVCAERSLEMIISILGILKAGAAYVPIDPDYPSDRISYLLNDTAANIVVSTNAGSSKLQHVEDIEIIITDDEWSSIDMQPKTNPGTATDLSDLAYVIYTSGSTGQPKGVMIEHGALLNYLLSNREKYMTDMDGNAGTFMHLSYTFDASITSIFMPLLSGKSVVIGSKQSFEVFEDENLLKYAPYDFIKLTPSHLPLLEPVMDRGRLLTSRMVIGGEALKKSHFDFLISKDINVELVNEYGPTEATVGCSIYSFSTITDRERIEESSSVSIGKPMDNVELYILNDQNSLLPAGVVGEIHIGGAGIARGYLNREELTSQKFIRNPFKKLEGSRLYRSGDLGKWLPDGNMEYIGRKDDQVKIRGYRVEPGEIEACLTSMRGVKEAKILVSENKAANSKALNAYVVAHKEIDRESFVQLIRANLKERLPEFMIPANIILIDQFPMTRNGKIDTSALPKPEGSEPATEEDTNVVAQTRVEKALVEIWKDLLGLDTVGLNDNFFNLGGDSIITIQLVSRARTAGYTLAVADVFTHQTIAKLTKYIGQTAHSSTASKGEQELLTGLAGLLPIQQWYFEKESADISHYNQSVLIGINKNITEDTLQSAIEELVAHHDALRFTYHKKDGAWQQQYGVYKGEVISEDLRSITKDKVANMVSERATHHQRSLDIEKGELIRVVLMKTPEEESNNRLFIVVHHLAVDGVSWRILLEDVERLVNGLTEGKKIDLGKKTSSYRQWFNALEDYGKSSRLLEQKSYWQEVTKSYEALPVDHNYTGHIRVKDTCRLVVRLGSEKTRQLLQEVPRVFHTEINDILLCGLARTLSEWHGTSKIVIGLEGHGREHLAEGIDTSRTVGWFTTLFPILLNGDPDKKAADLVKTVKEQLRQLPGKGLGYGVLKYINKDEGLAGKDPWDIVFNYMGQIHNAVKESKWLSIAPESTGQGIGDEQVVSEKLSINSAIRSGELVIDWIYSPKQYRAETISSIAGTYLSNLEWLIAEVLEHGKSTEVFTPSDYGLEKEISYQELDAFLEEDDKDNIMSF